MSVGFSVDWPEAPSWLSTVRKVGTSLGVVVVTLFGLLVITFVVGRMVPADPVIAIIGDQADQAAYQRVYEQLGLDRPLYQQFFGYVRDVLHFDCSSRGWN